MNTVTAAALLLEAAEILTGAYKYDPQHRKKPKGGGWRRTEKGWSNVKRKKKPAPKKPLKKAPPAEEEISLEEAKKRLRSNKTDKDFLERLSKSKNANVRRAVAKSAKTALIVTPSAPLRCAQNSSTT